jgi:hypothetical protein
MKLIVGGYTINHRLDNIKNLLYIPYLKSTIQNRAAGNLGPSHRNPHLIQQENPAVWDIYLAAAFSRAYGFP